MIIEIIVIILSFLFPAYLVYRYSGEEPGQQIEVQENGGSQNDFINSGGHHNNILNNTNINNNNTNNIYNAQNAFDLQIINIIKKKERMKTIDWENIEKTANDICKNLTDKTQKMVENPLEKIENILKERKLSNGKKAFSQWLQQKYKGGMNDKGVIVSMFENDKAANIYKNTHQEIIGFLNEIKDEEEKELLGNMSDGEYLQKKKNDFEELERIKEEEEKKKKLEEEEKEKKEVEEKKRLEEIENKAEEAKKIIVDEPEEGNPDATTIRFKYPDGKTEKDRRFLKTDTIQDLYNFVTSLGNEIYFERHNGFSLCQPFPMIKYDNMKNTLEQEGLSPNAVIQIKEE